MLCETVVRGKTPCGWREVAAALHPHYLRGAAVTYVAGCMKLVVQAVGRTDACAYGAAVQLEQMSWGVFLMRCSGNTRCP